MITNYAAVIVDLFPNRATCRTLSRDDIFTTHGAALQINGTDVNEAVCEKIRFRLIGLRDEKQFLKGNPAKKCFVVKSGF